MRWVTAFARFWYDFIVGDSIALAIGGPSVLLGGYLLLSLNNGVAQVALPVFVVTTLLASLALRSR